MITIGIDPGLRGCGLAIFCGHSELVHASYVKNPVRKGNDFVAARGMMDAVREAITREVAIPFGANVFLEVPVSYDAGSQKGPQQDLIHLSGFVYMIAGLEIFADSKLVRYYPREWKGTVEKGVTKVDSDTGEITSDGFAKRIIGRLSPEELARVTRSGALTHNTIDAIGVALKGLDRLEPRRVYGVIDD